MEDWQERVLDEQHELRKKIIRLRSFMNTSEFAILEEEDQKLLDQQFTEMEQYWMILQERIKRF